MTATAHYTRSITRPSTRTHPGDPDRRRRSRANGGLRPLSTIEWFALFIAALALAVALASTLMTADAPEVLRWEQRTVAEGATLWSIAESCAAPGLSVAETVELIRVHNMLEGGSLQPGQLVSVPAEMIGAAAIASR